MSSESFGNGTNNMNACIGIFRFIEDIPHRFGRIHGGFCVRHRQQLRNTSGSGGSTTGQHIFLIGLSGVTQMHMKVNQARYGRQTSSIYALYIGRKTVRCRKTTIFDEQITNLVHTVKRV